MRRFYDAARSVMSEGALRRQAEVRFGGRGAATTELEADESVFASWKEWDEDKQCMAHCFFVVVGIVQRCDLSKCYDKPVGVTKSAEGPPPPLNEAFWDQMCQEAFQGDENVVLHTDGAAAYRGSDQRHHAVVLHTWVNHQQQEFSRPEQILENVDTRATRRGMAGTQLIDGEWQELKECFPRKTGMNASTPAGRERLMMYFRAAQWTRFVSTRDRWSAFLADAKDYMRKHASDELLRASSLHPQVVPLRRALKTPGFLEGGAEGESARDAEVREPEGPPQQQRCAEGHPETHEPDTVFEADAAGGAGALVPGGLPAGAPQSQAEPHPESEACPACHKPGCHPLLTMCPFHKHVNLATGVARYCHDDAQLGDNVPHIHEVDVQAVGRDVRINGQDFLRGTSGGEGNNCLLNTLQQLLVVPEADIGHVRECLQKRFPADPGRVSESNYLDFQAHCLDALQLLLGQRSDGGICDLHLAKAKFSVTCIDFRPDGRCEHGDAVGASQAEAEVALFVGREGGCHFFPLIRNGA